MISKEHIDTLLTGKSHVVGSDDQKIGSLGQIYVDDATGNPSWVTANTGLFGLSDTFIPLDEAQATDDQIRVPYTRERVKDAPHLEPNGHLNEEEQDRLYEYYGLTQGATGHGRSPDAAGGNAVGAAEAARGTTPAGPGDEAAMTRSEEQVDIGTERRATGKVRLRKYVVTENVTRTVPVTHEEVRVEREPITDADRVGSTDLGDDAQEVTLHDETPVVEKRTVPVEEVRLEKDAVADEQRVDAEVRRERIETETDDPRSL